MNRHGDKCTNCPIQLLLVQIDGALAARPLWNWRFIVDKCLSRIVRSTCFVIMSAGLATPGTLRSLKSPFLIRSWTQRSAVARWRILPNPLRRQMPIAAAASVATANDQVRPKSAIKAWSPKPCAEPLHIPVNSASAELKATVLWVVAQCFIRCEPCIIDPAEVDLLVVWQPP